MLTGLDVSHHNGPIDWPAVRSAGASFAFIKATDGEQFVDPLFHSNWRGAISAGLLVSAYHFFRPNRDAGAQFEHFMHAVGGTGGLSGQLIPALDVEDHGALSRADLSKSVQAWLDLLEAATRQKGIVYTFPTFNQTELTHTFGAYPLWAASYPPGGMNAKPVAFQGWSDWTFWQYTDHGSISGVAGGGTVDLDAFNGDEQALRDLII